MFKIRTVSITLALVQLLSTSNYSIEKKSKINQIVPKSRIETVNDNNDENLVSSNVYKFYNEDGYPIYYRFDKKSGKYKNISIFDDCNISSQQYGASQIDFKKRFDLLIEEPLIWKSLQNYYPEKDFASKEEAMFFYKEYFENIYKCGCGYASVANYVFHLYEGREEEFEKIFGYPIYTVDETGYVDFNYEVFILNFFNYSVNQTYNNKSLIIDFMLKDFYFNQLQDYLKSEECRRILPDDFERWTKDQWNEWDKFTDARDKKIHRLNEKWINAKNIHLDFGILLDASFGYLYQYLMSYGVNFSQCTCIDEPNTFSMDDIIACDNFMLYKVDKNNEKYDVNDGIKSHYVYVTKITKDNKIIVSSWGQKYIFDNQDANWTSKVLIKVNLH